MTFFMPRSKASLSLSAPSALPVAINRADCSGSSRLGLRFNGGFWPFGPLGIMALE